MGTFNILSTSTRQRTAQPTEQTFVPHSLIFIQAQICVYMTKDLCDDLSVNSWMIKQTCLETFGVEFRRPFFRISVKYQSQALTQNSH